MVTATKTPRKVVKKPATLAPLTSVKAQDVWPYIETVLGHSHRVLLYGPPGTGKTTVANRYGDPDHVYNVYMTEETPAAELRGHFVPKGGEWIWNHGPAVRAWLEGRRLVINEINSASGDALDFLLAILDDREIAGITLPTGEFVKPAEGFHVVATMNGSPSDLPEALEDRFTVTFHVEAAHPDALASLPKDIHKVAMAAQNEPGGSVSVRSWHAFSELRVACGEQAAAFAVFGSRAQAVLDAMKLA